MTLHNALLEGLQCCKWNIWCINTFLIALCINHDDTKKGLVLLYITSSKNDIPWVVM